MLAPVVLGAGVLIGAPASAAGTGSLTPFLDCVTVDAQSGDVTAYFGYSNTLGAGQVVAVGDENQVFPVDAYQGQPTVFNEGTYAQVFSVTFDPVVFPAIVWILNSGQADATADSPVCVSGVTSPATDVTQDGATLNGVVVPDGPGATYSFEYAKTAAMTGSTSTASQSFTGDEPGLVQVPVTGLIPDTTYYVRIDTQTGPLTTQGSVLSFTTLPPPPLAITTTSLTGAITGRAYSAQLTGTGGIQPYLWKITTGSLPAGLTLDKNTGIISGTATVRGTDTFTVTLSVPSLPPVAPASEQLSITVNPPFMRAPGQ